MVAQNLFICIIMAATGGFLSVAARAVVLGHARKRKEQQKQQEQSSSSSFSSSSSNEDDEKVSDGANCQRQDKCDLPTIEFGSASVARRSSMIGSNQRQSTMKKNRTDYEPSTTYSSNDNIDDDETESLKPIGRLDTNSSTAGSSKSTCNNPQVIDESSASVDGGDNEIENENGHDGNDRDRDLEDPSGQQTNDRRDDDGSSYPAQKQRHKDLKRQQRRETMIMLAKYLGLCVILKPIQFFAPWFGPVSIYWPVYVGSRMVSNLLIVGICMSYEKFAKPAQVATMVVVSAVIYITISGPAVGDSSRTGEPLSTTQLEVEEAEDGIYKEIRPKVHKQDEPPDFIDLLSNNWIAIIWLLVLGGIFVLSSLLILYRLFATSRRINSNGLAKYMSPLLVEVFIFLNAITTSTLSATISRGASTLVDEDQATIRILLTAVSWYIYLWWMVESFMEGRYVRSLKLFVPTETLGSVLLNGATGLIVWDDASTMVSWVGYITAIALLGLGVYLFSDLDFFKVQMDDEQDYLREHQAEKDDWHDLFASIRQCLTRAQVEQELMPHQRTMIRYTTTPMSSLDQSAKTDSASCAVRPSMEKMFSDPEIGTRSQSIDTVSRPMLPSIVVNDSNDDLSTSINVHDIASLMPAFDHVDLQHRRNASATSHTLVTLESLMSSHRTIWESSHGSLRSDETTVVSLRPMKGRKSSVTSTCADRNDNSYRCRSNSCISSLGSTSIDELVDNPDVAFDTKSEEHNQESMDLQNSIVIDTTLVDETMSPLQASSSLKLVGKSVSPTIVDVLPTQMEEMVDDRISCTDVDADDDDESTVYA